ncbi:hypothetical protein PS1_032941 [Malus domestica]
MVNHGLRSMMDALIISPPNLKDGLMKAKTCSVHTMNGHLTGVDHMLRFLRLHQKVLKLVLFGLQACITNFPTMVSQGLPFAWPNENVDAFHLDTRWLGVMMKL